jgi:hypothetical protein
MTDETTIDTDVETDEETITETDVHVGKDVSVEDVNVVVREGDDEAEDEPA